MSVEDLSLEELELPIGMLLKQAAQNLLHQACQQMEAKLVELAWGTLGEESLAESACACFVDKRSMHLTTTLDGQGCCAGRCVTRSAAAFVSSMLCLGFRHINARGPRSCSSRSLDHSFSLSLGHLSLENLRGRGYRPPQSSPLDAESRYADRDRRRRTTDATLTTCFTYTMLCQT